MIYFISDTHFNHHNGDSGGGSGGIRQEHRPGVCGWGGQNGGDPACGDWAGRAAVLRLRRYRS